MKTKDAIHNHLIGDLDSDDYEDMNQMKTSRNLKSSARRNANEVVTIIDSDDNMDEEER